MSRLGTEHRRVILAPSERADAMLSSERTIREPVLDGAEVLGERFVARDRTREFRPRRELVDRGKHRVGTDDERARATDAGGDRQVAHESDVGADERSVVREVRREPLRDGGRISAPVARSAARIGVQANLDRLAKTCVAHAKHVVGARHGRETKPALDRAEQASAARIVRVLAEKLDAPRHPKADRRSATTAEGRQLLFGAIEQLALAIGFAALMPASRSRAATSVTAEPRCCANCSVTNGTSARCERSRTGASIGIARMRRPNSRIPRRTAFGSSSSPRGLGDSPTAGVEDSFVEAPDIHADRGLSGHQADIGRLLDDVREISRRIALENGIAGESLGLDLSVGEKSGPRKRQRRRLAGVAQSGKTGRGIVVVGVEHDERPSADDGSGGQQRVGGSPRLLLNDEVNAETGEQREWRSGRAELYRRGAR